MVGKQLIKLINTAIKAGKTEARVLGEGFPLSSPCDLPSSPSPPLSSPQGLVDAAQPDLANQSPPLGGWEAGPRRSVSAAGKPLPRDGLRALLDWGVSGGDGVLLRQMVYGGGTGVRSPRYPGALKPAGRAGALGD